VGMKMPHLTHYKNIIYSLHFTNVSIILNSSTWNPSNLLIKLHLTVLECKFVGFNSNNIYNIFNIVKTLQFFSKAKTNVKVAFIFLNTKMSKCVLFIYLFIYSISWCFHTSDHPQGDLAMFGYRPTMKIEID
jgi:hypothetical protein